MKRRVLLVGIVVVLIVAGLWFAFSGTHRNDATATASAPATASSHPVARPQPDAPAASATPAVVTRAITHATTPPPPSAEIISRFTEWTRQYLAAGPKERAELLNEGVMLARQRRPIFKQQIIEDPQRALAEAVPMVVRQQLPPGIVELLEERVNRRADLRVYQGVPPPGELLPAGQTLTHRIAAPKNAPAYVAHVYGSRAVDLLGARNDALNGVAVDNQFAVNEEPVRVLEAGEVPDPAKQIVTSCPVSGKQVVGDDEKSKPVPEDATAVETPEQIVYLCGGYHKDAYTTTLYAEGGSGGPTNVTGILPATPTPALGQLKVLYIPLTFQDQNAIPATESTCYQVMRDVSNYYLQASYGKLTTLTTVTPPIKLPKNEAWYVQRDTSNAGDIDGLSLEMTHAREEARRIGFDYNNYDVTVVRLSGGARPTGGWGGGGNVWVYSDSVNVCAHEIGHTFGLAHANYWDTSGTSSIGPGANAEYGDPYDVMGGGGVPTDQYNVAAKNQIKWLPDNFVQNITASGLYRLHAMDQPILDPRNHYALTIVKDSQRTYWGELRQLYTGNATRPWVDKGMILGWKFPAGSGSNIQLIDTTPGSPYGKDDAPVALGQTFGDTEAGIYITTVGVSGTTPKYVDVVVNMGDFTGNHDPTLSLATSADNVPTGATVTFTATASDVDGDTLAYQWRNWGDTSVRIVSPNSPVITRTFGTAGTYVVSCTVSDMKGGTITREKVITVGNGGGKFTIAGRVTTGGAGLSGVLLNANGTNPVITDQDGYYTITNLAANTYSVTPLLYGYTFTELFNNSLTIGPSVTGADFDTDALPSVSITAPDAVATENSGSSDTATFRLTRTGDTTLPLTVNIATASGTASAGDYTFNPAITSASPFNTFTIAADSATLDVVVTTVNDATAEGPETLTLSLAGGSGYLVASNAGSATITIVDDDTTLPQVAVKTTTNTTVENSGTPGVFTFTRTGVTTVALTINYSVSGTATAGADYTALTGTVTLPAGSSSATVNVATIDDTLVESLETVKVTITSNAAYVIDPLLTTATVSIIDDDTPTVNVIASDPTATEVDLSQPGAVADTGTFLITRNGDTSQPLTIYYSMAGSQGSGVAALNGVDYEALPGVIQIPAGSSSASVTIIPRWDNIGETAEQVVLQLGAGPTNYLVGANSSATVTINDGAGNKPYVEVDNISSASEPATSGKFRFSLKGSVAGTVAVKFALTGTATLTSDYTVTLPVTTPASTFDTATGTGTLVLSSTTTTANTVDLTIVPVNDALPEDLESIICAIAPDPAYVTFLPTATATMWLKDDDQPTVWVDSQINTGGSVVNRITENAATSPRKFYVSRTGATTSALTVNFSLLGSATAGADYTIVTGATLTFDNATSTGVLTIPAGSQGADVSFNLIDDAVFEGTETMIFHLTNGSYSKTPDATIYIDDNETSTQKVAFDTTGASGSESITTVNIPVSLTSPAAAATSVDYVVDTGARASSTTTATTVTLPLPAYPFWVRVVRAGNVFTNYYSTDGANWIPRGSPQTIGISSTSYLAGIAVASGTSGTSASATLDSFSIGNLDAGSNTGASVSADIGSLLPAGSDSVNGGGAYSVAGGGPDITTSTTDSFHYVYFPITNSANCTVTARVTSIAGVNAASKTGVMIRETTANNSRHVSTIALKDGTMRQTYRSTAGSAGVVSTTTTVTKPWWVRLTRVGDVFSAFQSPDGNTWVQTGTSQTIGLSGELLAGLAVSARSDGSLSTATFDSMALTGSPPLQGRTVGYVNAQGSDSLDTGVYTVSGSGAAIGGSEDECHFVAAPVTGNFTLTARVLSQTGGASNAQAGVMVREGPGYRTRSLYMGRVANSGVEFIYRNGTVTTAFGDGIDYTLPSGTLTFNIGEQTKNIVLTVNDDSIPEPDETVTLILRNPNGTQLGPNTAFTYTIQDNDTPPGTPSVQFASSTSSVAENAGAGSILVTLSAISNVNVSVDYNVTGGTATGDGTDYTLNAGTLTFAPGETVKSLPLTLTDDSLIEGPETIVVALANAVNANLGSIGTHTLTITDDDFPVASIVANQPNATEAGTAGQFTISRTGPTTSALSVSLARSGTATSGTDYTAISTTQTIPVGASIVLVDVSPIQDPLNEGKETVILTVNANAAYTVGTPSSATVSIADDDRSTVSIVATDAVASETAGNTGTFTVTRTAPTTGALTVNLTVSGTATNGTDYNFIAGTLAFAANETSKDITVTPIDDAITEGDETVVIQLASGSYDIGGAGFDTVVIHDNDSPPLVYVTSPPANGALVASGNGLIVSASVTDDGAPQPVTVNWTQASGPGTAAFATPTQTTSAVTFSADGVYVLRITATDGQFTVSDQVTVIIGSAIAPADWIAQDMSPSTQQRGQSSQIGASYSLTGMGAGYATSADAAHLMARQVVGDASIVARLTTLTGPAAAPLAGVTIRDSLARSCNRAVLGYVPGTGLQFRTRSAVSTTDSVITQGAVTLPVWVKLDRNSATGAITASFASDVSGAPGEWNTIGSVNIAIADNIAQTGLTATGNSSTAGQLCTATFDNVTLAPAPSGPALITENFGTTTPTASAFGFSAGTYSIGGSGSMDSQGAFYGWQYYGDVMITAKEATATSTALNAHSGIMIRESMDNSAAYVQMGRCPTSSFNGYFWRTLASGSTGGVPSFTTAIRWMRLVRQGNRVTAYHAADVSGSPGTWTQLGQPQTVIMGAPVLVGFAVDNGGGTAGVLNNCTFSNLSVVPLNKAPVVDTGSIASNAMSPIPLNGTVTDDNFPTPPALTTQWSLLSGPGTVAFGNTSQPATTATLGIGGTYSLRLQADDTSAITFRDLTFTGCTTPFELWQAQQFAGSGGMNDPNAAMNQDPDHDGMSNLLEYALGTNPNAANRDPVVIDTELIDSQKYLRLTVNKNPAATDVQYVAEAVDALGNPLDWSGAGLIIEVDTASQLVVRDYMPVAPGVQRYMRLRVTRP